jgi:multimeric flavodoxin WrbA
MSTNKNTVLINASPKINGESVSGYLVSMLSDRIGPSGVNKTIINVRQSLTKHQTKHDFSVIFKADAIVIVFPLYIFCTPALLMRFLEDYYHYYSETTKISGNQKVYAIVNCGFPEAGINREAVRVIQSFSRHINAEYRFGILIGSGGMLIGAKGAPFMKKALIKLQNAFDEIKNDSLNNGHQNLEDVLINVNFPRRLYLFMGDRGFISAARKNGLKKKDMLRKPYRANEPC